MPTGEEHRDPCDGARASEGRRAEEGARLERLWRISTDLLGASTVEEVLDRLARGARDLTGARLAAVVHGLEERGFRIGATSRAAGVRECPTCQGLLSARGGVYAELLQGQGSLRLTDAELRSHPAWWGLPEGHVPLRGLLGVRMEGTERAAGTVMVSDKERGDFDGADEAALRQLAALAALALHHVEAHLEARARAAEAEQGMAALARADAALREADRRKDEFLALLGHELRNPLAPLLNAAQILERASAEGPERQEALEIIKRQTWHMVRLIDELLDVSRVAQGTVRLRKETIDLALVVESAVTAVRPLAAARGHQLEVRLPDGPVPVNADPTRLTQVLANLLDNAAKYTPRGGKVSLTATAVEGRAVIRVRDTGAGIAPQARAGLFQMFSRLESGLPGTGGGLGVGLALAKRLAELHDGTIELADFEAGQGTEVVVSLPLARPDRAPVPPLPAQSQHALPAELQILVVDDNLDAARSLGSLLRLMGFQVEVAHDGESALQLALARPPHVALLDLGLPGMDGFEIARRLRERYSPDELLLVAVTGWTQEEHRRRAREVGFEHHLAKPVDPAELRQVIERFWERRQAASR